MDCVVAPYEADAQLAFLNKLGIAQAVITEDSDLLAFGCKKVHMLLNQDKNIKSICMLTVNGCTCVLLFFHSVLVNVQ